ncbi:MAG: DUF4062 domain-containing protein [Candidatus Izemoplasmatales bacterium]|nr:DUF4062 domain-containing protein [Candidatus Izemoplasmatales bacterium]
MKQLIFISSVQKELAEERRAMKSYIIGDALLGRFFDVFLFEDMPAADRRADKVYLDQVDRCDVYLGLLGNDYGYEDAQGVSPTEREFDRATSAGKQRLIFVKGENDDARHPKMQSLTRHIEKAGTGILDMIGLCKAAKLRPPEFRQEMGQFIQTLWRPTASTGAPVEAPVEPTATDWRILTALSTNPLGRQGLLATLGYAQRTGNFKKAIEKLLSMGWIKMSIPDKPHSRLQKYRLTEKGTVYVLAKGAAKGPKGPSAGRAESAINRPNRPSQAKRNGPQKDYVAQQPSPESKPDKKPANRAAASRRKIKGSSNI